MQHFLSLSQIYSGAIQAFATVVLIAITAYYAHITRQSLSVARDQLEANLVPQISVTYKTASSSVSPSTGQFTVDISLSNGGGYPFTIISAEARIHATYDSIQPTETITLDGLAKRVVGSRDSAKETIAFTVPRALPVGDVLWKMELSMRIHDAVRGHEYQYVYDNVRGLRQLSTGRFFPG